MIQMKTAPSNPEAMRRKKTNTLTPNTLGVS